MYWQEDETEKFFQVPDAVVDVLFSIDCKRLPVDHAYSLSTALKDALPWLEQDPGVGIHRVHVAGSQNGWERPDQYLMPSRRTKLTIRVPKARMDELLEDLHGRTLDVAGCALKVGQGRIRPLSKQTTIFARYLTTLPDDSEEAFLTATAVQLRKADIRVRKALCGKNTHLSTPGGTIHTRSLMLANLSAEESVRLQQVGLGPYRDMGCGIFIPHKGIDSVKM